MRRWPAPPPIKDYLADVMPKVKKEAFDPETSGPDKFILTSLKDPAYYNIKIGIRNRKRLQEEKERKEEENESTKSDIDS